MALDAITLRALTTELNDQLAGAIVNKVLMPEKDEIHLVLRNREGQQRLVISLGSNARIHLSSERKENPAAPPMFCMFLRKHLISAKIVSINQYGFDRIALITFDTHNEMGDTVREMLVFELLGKSINLILKDEEEHIIDCFRKTDLSADRRIMPGLYYEFPEQPDKIPLTGVDDIRTICENALPDSKTADLLLKKIGGLSPLCCRELVYRSSGSTDTVNTDIDLEKLQMYFSELQKIVKENCYKPVMILDQSKPKDFSFWMLYQYENVYKQEILPNFSALIEKYYSEREQAARWKQHTGDLQKIVQNSRQRLERKIASQKDELLQAKDRENIRRNGDLIMANLYQLKRGDTVLKCQDFYDIDQKEISIKLDPSISPQENAAKCYKTYQKRKNAEKILEEQISGGEKEITYLDSVLEEIGRVETFADIEAIRYELQEQGVLKKQTDKKKQQKKSIGGPMQFKASDGTLIYAGRNNQQNDQLTMHDAKKQDIWLHSQKIHGCHVIVETGGCQVSQQTLLEAATIAATYSKASESSNVPIDYCPVRQVKKPNGAKPGMVIYENYRTVYVNPDKIKCESMRVK